MITITTVIMIITIINHNNHNDWNPHIHKIIIWSSPLHTTNFSPQLPCLEWRHCDLLANETGTCFFQDPKVWQKSAGKMFFPIWGVFFLFQFFVGAQKGMMWFVLQEKNVGSWGRWGSQLQTLILLKLPLAMNIPHDDITLSSRGSCTNPPSLRGKNESWGF